jgi:hypothetical protein
MMMWHNKILTTFLQECNNQQRHVTTSGVTPVDFTSADKYQDAIPLATMIAVKCRAMLFNSESYDLSVAKREKIKEIIVSMDEDNITNFIKKDILEYRKLALGDSNDAFVDKYISNEIIDV